MATTITKQKNQNETTRKDPAARDLPLAAPKDFSMLMRSMQNEFDQMFDRLARNLPMAIEDYGRDLAWGIEVDDRDDAIVLQADAPGFAASDFDIRLCGNRLVLNATRRNEKKEKSGESLEEKRCYEAMMLPAGVDTEKIDAKYQDGVLTVTIPKTPEGRGRKIEVK